MTYMIFANEDDALASAQAIDDDVRSTVQETSPDAVDENGYLVGRNALTGALAPDKGRTKTWAAPVDTLDGWVLPEPPRTVRDHPRLKGRDILARVKTHTKKNDVRFREGDAPLT